MITRLTSGPAHHFFGYYGINSWSPDGSLHLALETDFHERLIRRGDTARVGTVCRRTGAFNPLLETCGFNFQQGSMLHWVRVDGREAFSCNDVDGAETVTRVLTPQGETLRTVPRGLAALAPDGRTAVGLDFARMYHCRSVVGYCSELREREVTAVPEDDGLFAIDLQEGSCDLVLSIAELLRIARCTPKAASRAWFTHAIFNPAGNRVMFLCRVRESGSWSSALWSVNPDGTDPCCLLPFGRRISHFAWLDEERIVVSTDALGPLQFTIFTDRKGEFKPFGGDGLPADGHMSFSPDRAWMVSDTYPQGEAREAALLLYRMGDGAIRKLGGFRHGKLFSGDIRCDLHPRWSGDGQQISFDSVHEGTRQIYIADFPAAADLF